MSRVVASAKVKVMLEVQAATWDPSSQCQQLLDTAGREAVSRIQGLISRSDRHEIKIVGDPEVDVVVFRVDK